MTAPRPPRTDALSLVLADYGAGLRAELILLQQIRDYSLHQQHASGEGRLTSVSALAGERERLVAALVELEQQLRPLRAQLAENVALLSPLPQFQEVSALHREAGALVATIMGADDDTLRILRDAEDVRRAATHAIETGEATLAAYRRAVSPTTGPAGLLDQRG